MAVFHPYSVKCNCGNTFEAKLALSVNGERAKELRDAILAGTFHCVRCPACDRVFTVEKSFAYTDLSRNTVIAVRPRRERHLHVEASKLLAAVLADLPPDATPEQTRHARVVFGLQELREKLVAQDAGVDDRVLEMLKLYLLHEHPFLMQKARLRLALHLVHEGAFEFIASHDHSQAKFRLLVPEGAVRDLERRREELKTLLDDKHDENPFKEPAPWTNLWRYSPQTSALATLHQCAQTLASGGEIDFDSEPVRRMFDRLPRGAHLPAEAKRQVEHLFKEARRRGLEVVMKKLTEVRFNVPLEDHDWTGNGVNDDIDVIWDVLIDLPPSDVEGSTTIGQLLLEEEASISWYDPSTHDISISEDILPDRELFAHVLRHEVGHSVHQRQEQEVNTRLRELFGWRVFDLTDEGINAWVGEMGGWGTLSDAEREAVRDVLWKVVGSDSRWAPTEPGELPLDHPWWTEDLAPRLACEKSGDKWYRLHPSWYRAGNKAFGVNYYNRELLVMNEDTSRFISDVMPTPVAAMSAKEFFAELYAMYHAPDVSWRTRLSTEVQDWLASLASSRTPTPLAA